MSGEKSTLNGGVSRRCQCGGEAAEVFEDRTEVQLLQVLEKKKAVNKKPTMLTAFVMNELEITIFRSCKNHHL
jgi:hypothetical protein